MRARPPLSGLVRRLLGLFLSREDHRTLLSELDESFELRRNKEGDEAARAWLRREGRRAVMHAARARLRGVSTGLRVPGGLGDLRHGARRLLHAPAFTLTVVVTVALGIGGTTGVFSVVHGVLIEPLPYPDPGELVQVYTEVPDQSWNFSMVDVQALSEQQTTFREVAFMSRGTATLETPNGAEQIRFRPVTPSFFRLLGLEPALGRGFTDDEAEQGAEPVAVVSRGFWQTRMGADPAAVGGTIRMNGRAVTVVGVLPGAADPLTEGFEVLTPLPIFTPPRKGPFSYVALARVDDEMRGAAGRELAAIEDRIFPRWRDSWPRPEATWLMRDLKEMVVGDTGPVLWIMLGAVGLLLLIASVNAANLLVARGLRQQRELAVRAALGASRRRLLRHLLSESTLLALLGAGAGLGLAVGGIRLVRAFGRDFIPRTSELGLSGPVLVFLGATTLGALVLFGLVPALQSSGGRPGLRLRSAARSADADAGARRLRRVLVGGQFAVTAPLLVGAGLLLTSLEELRGVDPGFDAERIVTARIVLPPGTYGADRDRQRAAWERLLARIRSLPGVEAAGLGTGRPPDRWAFGNNFVLEDRPLAEGEAQPATPWVIAEPGYFEALGLEAVEGRIFDADRDPPRVLLVDETWARRFFPDGSAVGRRLRQGGCTVPSCDPWTVIGVVEDVRYTGLADAGEGTVYMNFQRWTGLTGFLVVQTKTARPEALIPTIRRTLKDQEPGAPVSELVTGRELLSRSLREPRYLGFLVAAFAALALVLALVGVYGIMTYFVQQHRREIGIRLALGGRPSSVAGLVLGSGMKLAVAGTVLGVALGLGLSGYLESLLFRVEPADPAVFAGVGGLLVAVAVAACWGPAWRAGTVNPVETLREE